MVQIQHKLWSRQEYDRLVEAGILPPDERVELLEGEIIQMPPQSAEHSSSVYGTTEALRAAFGRDFVVRGQFPFGAGDYSEPEPDVVVARGHWRDFTKGHPTSAVLVVEVARTSLVYDRQRKGPVYAKAGVPEYWIVNLDERVVEVYRGPRPDGTWESLQVYREGDSFAPLAASSAVIAVTELLP